MPSMHLYTSWYLFNRLLVKILCQDTLLWSIHSSLSSLYLVLHADSWYKIGACLKSNSSGPKSQLSCLVTPCMLGIIVNSTWENVKPLGWCLIPSSNSVSKLCALLFRNAWAVWSHWWHCSSVSCSRTWWGGNKALYQTCWFEKGK